MKSKEVFYHITKDDKRIPLNKLPDSHLNNIIKYIESGRMREERKRLI